MPQESFEVRARDPLGEVTEPAFLGALGHLRLVHGTALGTRVGQTPLRGRSEAAGLEVERYKPYEPTDELRFVDWNAYARLGDLIVRRFRPEREAPLRVFVDASASMAVPAQDGKFEFAGALALALAYVALRQQDPVELAFLVGESCLVSPEVRSVSLLPELLAFARGVRPSGRLGYAVAVRRYLERPRGPGLAVFLSDFLFPREDLESVFSHVSRMRLRPVAIRVLGPAEREPERFFRRALVVDAETGREKPVLLHEQNVARYRKALGDHLGGVEDLCRSYSGVFAVCDPTGGLRTALFRTLVRAGLLRSA
ncbi:MAG: hypothetical protein KatS3mg076_1328 [Candidatus Binatia bacterium]|nr:MAG: hypothetical protein KatS3mg076_1328 [Candidatus Binatia bacterium]